VVANDRILDEYLVAAARAGAAKARALLVHRWHKKLLAHAIRLTGDAERARDAVQESWIEILRGMQGLRDDRAFPAWAYRITSRRCAKAVLGIAREREACKALAAEPVLPVEPEFGDAPDNMRLREAIRALPPGQRAAIALFHFEELSVAEVAVALNVPAGTVKTRLMHARRKLRAALEGEA
jgi:RNA polymerase sigma factor (sigma-70 family)